MKLLARPEEFARELAAEHHSVPESLLGAFLVCAPTPEYDTEVSALRSTQTTNRNEIERAVRARLTVLFYEKAETRPSVQEDRRSSSLSENAPEKVAVEDVTVASEAQGATKAAAAVLSTVNGETATASANPRPSALATRWSENYALICAEGTRDDHGPRIDRSSHSSGGEPLPNATCFICHTRGKVQTRRPKRVCRACGACAERKHEPGSCKQGE